jgi:hypothetical protein
VPKLIDYVGRFEFIRQAAFAVVRDEGVDALSRRRVAQELGTSVNTIRRSVAGWADLARLAADHVVARRRAGRWNRRSDDPVERAAIIVRSLMPEDRTHLDEELVWLKLLAGCALRPSGLAKPGELRHEFGIGQRGYDDDPPMASPGSATAEHPGPTEHAGQHPAPASADREAPESRRAALSSYVTRRDEQLTESVSAVLDLLEVPEPRPDLAATVVALVEGLTLAACLGRLTPEEATRLAVDHVVALRPPTTSPPTTSPPTASPPTAAG